MTLNLTTVPRPPTSLALNWQRLWWNKRENIVYCYGGELSWANDAAKAVELPPASIWGFTPDGQGRGEWAEVIGPTSEKPFPSSIIMTAAGVSAYDDSNGYYIGGFVDKRTSLQVLVDAGPTTVPGLLTYSFDSSTITNTSDGHYQGIWYPNKYWMGPAVMLNVPVYGSDGILVLMGGNEDFHNITIFDKHAHSWLSQTAAGSVPAPRSMFCAIGIQASDYSYEMCVNVIFKPYSINLIGQKQICLRWSSTSGYAKYSFR